MKLKVIKLSQYCYFAMESLSFNGVYRFIQRCIQAENPGGRIEF